jgi:DNA-binding transcriptional ArsR family regulator
MKSSPERTVIQAEDRADLCEVTHVNPRAAEAARSQLIDGAVAARLAETFKVLGDPTRVRIIHALSLGELCTCDLAAVLGLSESTVSHQLRMLRLLNLVKFRREGRVVHYSLDDEHIERLFMDSYRHVMEG